ncbi:MAG: Asp-tRNA(Asn)/Glu-tRNA(Gln) amidotransferase subunit GatC [Phycisphaeraceae bacterium]|nr:Asp-tRNA(Asn)/Glu-tRNA(Gln) amidotransferase subunit GatC [Phycisphaeraceae bacterium]
MSHESLSPDYVRRIAKLSRLSLTDEQVAQYGARMSAVLGYMNRLRELNLEGVEPMANVGGTTNRFDEDVPGPTLSNDALMKIAPDTMPPFVKVPKVLGEGGGA